VTTSQLVWLLWQEGRSKRYAKVVMAPCFNFDLVELMNPGMEQREEFCSVLCAMATQYFGSYPYYSIIIIHLVVMDLCMNFVCLCIDMFECVLLHHSFWCFD